MSADVGIKHFKDLVIINTQTGTKIMFLGIEAYANTSVHLGKKKPNNTRSIAINSFSINRNSVSGAD